jgi:hypothetical protein
MKYGTVKKASLGLILAMVMLIAMVLAGVITGIYYIINIQSGEGIVFIGAGVLFLIPVFLIFLQSYAWYTGYYVLENRLILRGVYKKETILYKNISMVKILSEDEARTLMEEPMEKAANRGREGDLKGWYQENKRYSKLLKYCTIQFVHSSAGGHSYKSEQYTGVKLQEGISLVLLEQRDGSRYILSPKSPEKFVSLVISKR